LRKSNPYNNILKAVLLICFALALKNVSSQTDGVSIAPINTPPHDNAMLDVQSTDKGMLIPRMTESQMQAISPTAGADGLQVFVTDNSRGLWFYDEAEGKWVRYGIDIDKLMPVGIVLPFDDNQCPAGWVPFALGEGRFIVGLGTTGAETYTKDQPGGSAKVQLSQNNLPDHDHTFTGSVSVGSTNSVGHAHDLYTRGGGGTAVGSHRDVEYGKGGNRSAGSNNTSTGSHSHTVSGTVTGNIGNNLNLQGMPHENRPAYIAVKWCKRNF